MKNLAIFDLDHTLIACDSDIEWVNYLQQLGILDASFIKRHQQCYQAYADGSVDGIDFVLTQLSTLKQVPKAVLDSHLSTFLSTIINPKIYPDGKSLIQQHKTAGDDIVLISATYDYLVKPIGQILGIENSIGIHAEQNALGEFTGQFIGTPSFREGKITCLHEWLSSHAKVLSDYDQSHFYSDSINDLPLLKIVSHPHTVNADTKLKTIADSEQWSTHIFAIASS